MSEIRAFIALDLEPKATAALHAATNLWQQHAGDNIDWILPENYHLTLVFLGNIDESILMRLSLSLSQIAQDFSPLTLSLQSLDYFPNPEHPSVVAAHVAPTLELMRLQKRIVADINMDIKPQAFLPHITVGRFRENAQGISLSPQVLSIHSIATAICLYRSHTAINKMKYEKLDSFALSLIHP